ncbi:MAG: hypothetical protein JXX29_05040 [Deltaproteobacteria bacterium]|nr:hypothetical protein [Deltaproteobacteria bacterium]MBN2671012.1 hypothetical protein [Deltaproteobacteria bacterium]
MKRLMTCQLLFLLWMSIGFTAVAQETEADEPEGMDAATDETPASQAAIAAFERGNTLFLEEQFAEAAQAFREAYTAKPSWKLWYNIGQAEAAAKHYGLGLVAFETYLAEGGDQVPQERSIEVLAEVKRLRELVGSLDVVADPGCGVFIDGVHRGDTPLAALIKLAAGTNHEVVVEKGGEVLLHREIRLSGGDVRTLNVNAEDEAAEAAATAENDQPLAEASPKQTEPITPEPTSSPIVQPQSKGLKVAGLITLGTGIAALAVGGVTGALAFKSADSLEDKCSNSTCSTDGGVDDMYTSQAYGNVSTVLFSAGGALAVTGIVLLVVHKKKQSESIGRFRLTPVVGSTVGGVQLKGRF